MLTEVADGVFVHESTFCQSEAVVVRGPEGVLVIDAGVHEGELTTLANDIFELGERVVAGFSTHPHWDHMLWHVSLGDMPRYATQLCVDTATPRIAAGIDKARLGIPEDVPFELLGALTGVPADATEIPWHGPRVRIIEHRGHAPGSAALLIEDAGVFVAGDMLSDGFMPMLDLRDSTDPLGEYLAALDLFETVVPEVRFVIPGHGAVGGDGVFQQRITQDRAYVTALQNGRAPDDPRIDARAQPGWEWVADVHARQVAALS